MYGYVFQNKNGRKSWEHIEDPVVPHERNFFGHPFAGLLWERQFEKAFKELGWGKVPNWECLYVHRKQHYSNRSVWMTSKFVGKKQHLALMCRKLMKDVDIEEPTSFLDHVYQGCIQRECKPNEKIIGQYNKMFESRISAKPTEKLPGWDKPRAKTSAWSYDMEGHARKMRGTVLRIGKQKDGATIRSFSSLFGRSPNQKRRIGK